MKKKIVATVILFSVFLTACGTGKVSNNSNVKKASPNKSEAAAQDNSKYVSLVKEGEPENYKGEAYGQYFEKYFINPSWKYKNNDGENIVQFTGECTYRDTNITAKIDFLVDTDTATFTMQKVTFNDIPQDHTAIDELMTSVFGNAAADDSDKNKTDDSSNADKDNAAGKDNTASDGKTQNSDKVKDSTSNDQGTTKEVNGQIDKQKAVQLVKNYLKTKGEYIPKVIEVDSEDDKNFNVHCYDVVDSGKSSEHTATSGWYYVDKKTGKVTSMF